MLVSEIEDLAAKIAKVFDSIGPPGRVVHFCHQADDFLRENKSAKWVTFEARVRETGEPVTLAICKGPEWGYYSKVV